MCFCRVFLLSALTEISSYVKRGCACDSLHPSTVVLAAIVAGSVTGDTRTISFRSCSFEVHKGEFDS